MEEKITSFIKDYLLKITNNNFSKKDIKKFILPFLYIIFNNNFNKILISGSQGVGKTTYLKLIEIVGLKFFKKKVLNLSIDDFYLDKNERINLAAKIHPLLKTRGVPGTHDIKKLKSIIQQFQNSQYPISTPLFNKLTDRKKKILKKHNKCDLLILEGWCAGCPRIPLNYLYKDINSIEKKYDKHKKWRKYYNNKLKTTYADVFNLFDYKIFFKSSSFSNVLSWRIKQEKNQIKISKNKKNQGMSESEIKVFIKHYEKITKYMLKSMPLKANLIIGIDQSHKIINIKRN